MTTDRHESKGERELDGADTEQGETARTVPMSQLSRSGGKPAPAPEFEPGQRVGRYVVVDSVGHGGMGVVIAVHDPTLGRKIALKLLRPEEAGSAAHDDARKRLLREAQAMAQLSHPNVVVVHEVGTVEGRVYVAMEYVDGFTLRGWRGAEQRTWKEIVDVYVRAGHGLAAAHAAGLIHRDFKPENVLIGSDGRVRVTDFGLVGTIAADTSDEPARDCGSSDQASTTSFLSGDLTQTGSFMGTPVYMAPEQHRREKPTAQTDQFSFCVALFEALYGQRPFEGKAYKAISANVCAGRVIDPPAESDVPSWIHRVLLRGLSTKPGDRYPSVEALLSALESDPTAARRRRLGMGAVAVVILGLAALAAFGLARNRKTAAIPCNSRAQLAGVWDAEIKERIRTAFLTSERPHAQATFERVAKRLDEYAGNWATMQQEFCAAASSRGDQATAAHLRMVCMSQRLDALRALTELFATESDPAVTDKAVFATLELEGLDECARNHTVPVVMPPPEDPAQRNRVNDLRRKLAKARVLDQAGKYREALEIASAVSEEAATIGYLPLRAEALFRVGRLQDLLGDANAAERTLRSCTEVAVQARDDRVAAEAWSELILTVGDSQKRHREALEMRELGEAAVARAGNDVRLRAGLLNSLASAYRAEGDYAAALEDLERALPLWEKSLGPEHPRFASTLNSLAGVYHARGEYDKAVSLLKRALAIRQKTLGSEHPSVGSTLNNMSLLLLGLGRYDEALDYANRALRLKEKALGPDHREVAMSLNNMGEILRRLGRYEEAKALYERALRIWERTLSAEHPNIAMASSNLGETLIALGDYDDGLTSCERAVRIQEKSLGNEHPDLSYPLTCAGTALLERHDAVHARAPLSRALELRERSPGPPEHLAQIRFQLARVLWSAKKDRKRAAELAQLARVAYADAGTGYARELAQVEAWLASRRLTKPAGN